MSEVQEKIKELRPNLKDNTIKQYETQLRKLQKIFDTDNYKFLDDPKKVEEKLSHLHYTSRRNVYNAVIILLMALDKDKKLIEEYGEMRDELNKQYQDEQASGKISEKQKDNFVDIEELYKMLEQMEKEIKPLKKKDKLNQNERQLIKAYTIFSSLVRIPVRNDLAGLIFISKTTYNKLSDKEKEENNYLVQLKNNLQYIFNEYKTAKKYKENVIDIPKDLQKILRMYIKFNDYKVGDVIFPISKNGLTQLLTKYSMKYMNKKISSTMIRKSYLSSKYSDMKKEMEKDSKIMGHSVGTAQKVYVKDSEDMEEVGEG
tara:strand:+ start:15754 stop:16701 length:948 start_codon:yes stop_codon:yes gene_type:complete